MAEGGAPPEPEGEVLPIFYEPPRWLQVDDTLELRFTRDFLTHIIRRKVPDWTFDMQYGMPCPCTPFSFRIRQAVDFYLVKESIDFYFLFRIAFMNESLTYEGFVNAVNFAVQAIFPQLTESNKLLRMLCLYAEYTAKAVKLKINMAPYFALVHIQCLLAKFIVHRKRQTPEYFFGHLGYEAEYLIHEDTRRFFDNVIT